ncbi:MAG: hypothetical protein EPN22_04550 [Nitrospirae bacterium]|nr:MAG: hypothetical protein EPN22_04550 [Nitrospirota bacterium]
MNYHMPMLIILFASPAIILITHMSLSRIWNTHPRQAVAIRAALIGGIAVSLLLSYCVFSKIPSPREMIRPAFYSAIVYGAIAYVYFHFFNMSETARRIRIMYEVYQAKSICCDKITDIYKTTDIISIRLRRMTDMKQLRLSQGYYSVNSRVLYCAALLVKLWRSMLGFK